MLLLRFDYSNGNHYETNVLFYSDSKRYETHVYFVYSDGILYETNAFLLFPIANSIGVQFCEPTYGR